MDIRQQKICNKQEILNKMNGKDTFMLSFDENSWHFRLLYLQNKTTQNCFNVIIINLSQVLLLSNNNNKSRFLI